MSRFAGECQVWLNEMPDWALLKPVGQVDTYWRWASRPPVSAPARTAGWGFRVGFGGRGAYGVLGATFLPNDYSYLRVVVDVTGAPSGRAPKPFQEARVGLLHEYAGAVLAGSLQEADTLGPGTLAFHWGAVHEVDSSWEAFRVLSVGVGRLVALPSATAQIPAALLPSFGGQAPPPPGVA